MIGSCGSDTVIALLKRIEEKIQNLDSLQRSLYNDLTQQGYNMARKDIIKILRELARDQH